MHSTESFTQMLKIKDLYPHFLQTTWKHIKQGRNGTPPKLAHFYGTPGIVPATLCRYIGNMKMSKRLNESSKLFESMIRIMGLSSYHAWNAIKWTMFFYGEPSLFIHWHLFQTKLIIYRATTFRVQIYSKIDFISSNVQPVLSHSPSRISTPESVTSSMMHHGEQERNISTENRPQRRTAHSILWRMDHVILLQSFLFNLVT